MRTSYLFVEAPIFVDVRQEHLVYFSRSHGAGQLVLLHALRKNLLGNVRRLFEIILSGYLVLEGLAVNTANVAKLYSLRNISC